MTGYEKLEFLLGKLQEKCPQCDYKLGDKFLKKYKKYFKKDVTDYKYFGLTPFQHSKEDDRFQIEFGHTDGRFAEIEFPSSEYGSGDWGLMWGHQYGKWNESYPQLSKDFPNEIEQLLEFMK